MFIGFVTFTGKVMGISVMIDLRKLRDICTEDDGGGIKVKT
jgi:hypothetical protein